MSITKTNGWVAIVVFGAPSKRYRKVRRMSEVLDALKDAQGLIGSGSCQDARVWSYPSREAARAADISDMQRRTK